jgi:hypothetical protein
VKRLAALALLAAWIGAASAATVQLRPGGSLQQALRAAVDGDTIEIAAGDYRGEVGVITHKALTLRGVGGRPVFHAAGRSAEGKAILVVRDGQVRIENIEFRGARVADRNGAGLRFERGHLEVLRCNFVDNENGILTAGFADAELRIEDSDFSQAPADTPLPHLLYVGQLGRLTVLRSRFSGGNQGHLLKSRALVSEVRDSRFVDGPGGQAAYELEFPNGGIVTVTGNVIGQSAGTSNPTIVSYGAEGYADRPHALTFSDNTVFNEAPRPAYFLRVREAVPPIEIRVEHNRLYGAGDPGPADAARGAHGNTQAPLGALPAGYR